MDMKLSKSFSPIVALLVNLLIAFVVYNISRIEFILENLSYFSEHLSFSYLLRMFGGGYMFDRSCHCLFQRSLHRFNAFTLLAKGKCSLS